MDDSIISDMVLIRHRFRALRPMLPYCQYSYRLAFRITEMKSRYGVRTIILRAGFIPRSGPISKVVIALGTSCDIAAPPQWLLVYSQK